MVRFKNRYVVAKFEPCTAGSARADAGARAALLSGLCESLKRQQRQTADNGAASLISKPSTRRARPQTLVASTLKVTMLFPPAGLLVLRCSREDVDLMRSLMTLQPLHLTGVRSPILATVVHVAGSQRQCANAIQRVANALLQVPIPQQLSSADRNTLDARIADMRI